jgi:hypothetical protein
MAWLVPLLLPLFRELLVALAPLLVEIIRAGVQDTVEVGAAPDDLVRRLRERVWNPDCAGPGGAARADPGAGAGKGVVIRGQFGAGSG